MDNEMTIEQLPKAFLDKLNEKIEQTDKMKRLRKRLNDCMARLDYIGVMNAREDIKHAQEAVYRNYLKQHATILKRTDALINGMSDKDRELWQMHVHTMLLLVDMMEFTSMSIDEIVGKYMKNGRITRFDKVLAAGKEAKEQTEWMFHVSDSNYQKHFAVVVDDLIEMVHNKVRSLLRKTYQS